MAYSELIKNFSRIRSYMRDFYVYGFKRRDEYVYKSARSYDNERRRVESWLGDYMAFRRTDAGKNVFLTVDSRTTAHNPFYKAFKAKSFTDGDITLHFLLFDILLDETVACSLQEIAEQIADGYLARFDVPMEFDESTLRKSSANMFLSVCSKPKSRANVSSIAERKTLILPHGRKRSPSFPRRHPRA